MNGSSCMTGVGWNLAEEGHSQPTQVNNMTLGKDPVISTLLYLFGLVEVRLRCSMLLLQGAQPLGRVGNDSMGKLWIPLRLSPAL